MKKTIFISILIAILVFTLTNSVLSQENTNILQLNHFEVLYPALISFGFVTSYLILDLFYNVGFSDSISYELLDLSLFLTVLPMFFYNLPMALIFSATSLGLYFLSETLYDIDEDFLAQLPSNGFMDFSFFTTYAIYRDRRKLAKIGIYNNNWREEAFGNSSFISYFPYEKLAKWEPQSFFDLVIAPISKKGLSDALLFPIIPAGLIAPFLQQLLAGNNFEQSIFATGKAFIGMHELPILLGVPIMAVFLYALCSFVAIGEESLFRGFIYEELGSSYNEWVAKISDMLIFPLFHVPSEIEFYQQNPEYFLNYFIRRSILTFYIDLMYDRGGLLRSVAFHFWVDFTQLLAFYLIYGGVAHDDFTDIIGMYFKRIEIQFSFSF
ncbi:MAG: CPBP family intramembrane metalloprotease [Spirochaetales bacterium]|nr:CPBP family intramembrane metalloprotease [Spirochaetales bacterium]